ncbi:MAG: right-handed parallel beta-helix repeat-containing protein [Gemmatimonadales bacterium]|jgi:hypothetical protein
MTPLRRLLLMSAAAGCLTAAWVGPAAAQSIPVTVGGEASSLVGVSFDLPIEIDMSARTELLGSFALAMRWDPTVLELVGGQEGDFGAVTVNEDSLAAGVLLASGVNAGGVGGRITVLVGRFRPLVADTTTLTLDVSELFAAGTFADLSADAAPANQPYCPALGRYGDVDSDGAANSRDALIALSASVGLDVSGFNVAMGDVDNNGSTEARDALIILSHAVGLDVSQFRLFGIAPGACAAGVQPTLVLDPGDLTVSVGQAIEYQAIGTDTATGEPVAVTNVFWSSSNDSVAAVGPGGRVVGLAPGSAVITARQSGGDSASATVTVSADRHLFWVDGLAAGARNQLGDSAYPFATIQDAAEFAGTGDTLRVRPGRYAEDVYVTDGVVIEGDTSLGGMRPLLAATSQYGGGLYLDVAGRVELRNFRTDTLYNAVVGLRVDTLVVDNVEFRLRAGAFASIQADTVGALMVRRSRMFGPAEPDYSSHAIFLNGAGLVSVDSSLIADYGDDALSLTDVDSLDLRDNVVRDNYGWGVWLCNGCFGADTTHGVSAVVLRNQFTKSQGGQVALDVVESATFERNVFVGGGGGSYYDAVQLIGHGGTVASFLADSFDVRNGPWLEVGGYDSLLVDSAVVVQRGDYGYWYGGRTATVRDTRFLELNYGALDVESWPRDSTNLVLQNVEFLGPDSSVCDLCGYAVYADQAAIAADSITGRNLGILFDTYSSWLRLTNSTFDHVYYGIDAYCGSTALSAVTGTDGEYAVYHSGCSDQDSVTIDQSQFQYFYRGLYASDGSARVTGSSFRDIDYPIETSSADVLLTDDTLSNGRYGVEAYGYLENGQVVRTLAADGLWIEQFQYYGFYGWNINATVTNSVLTNIGTGIYLSDGAMTVTDNQLTGIEDYGVELYSDTYGNVTAARNSVTCDYQVGGYEGLELWTYDTDTTVAQDNVVTDCRNGIYARGPFTEVRGNSVAIPAALRGTSGNGIEARGDTALAVVGNSVTGPARYGSIDVSYSDRAVVDSNTVRGSVEAGLYAIYADSLWMRDNVVTAHDTASCCLSESPGAIVLGGLNASTAYFAELSGNRIDSSLTSGIVLYRNNSGDTVTVLVDSNAVQGATTYGIYVTAYSRALLTNNAIDSTITDAVRVDRWATDSTAVVAHQNNFTRSTRYGFNNADGSGAPYDATNNWWNDANGPSGTYGDTSGTSVGDSVSAYVKWDPWLTAPNGSAPTPAPILLATQPVSSVRTAAATPIWPAGPLRGSEPAPERPALERPVTFPTPAAITVPTDALPSVRTHVELEQEWETHANQAVQDRLQRRADRADRRDAVRQTAMERFEALMIQIRQREADRAARDQAEEGRQR